MPENALGDAELGSVGRGGGALRVDEVVHVSGQVELIGEVARHRGGGVQDDEDVRGAPDPQQLPVVRGGGRGVQEREDECDRDAVAGREVEEDTSPSHPGAALAAQNGNLAGRGPTSTSATRAFEYCAKAWSLLTLRTS